MKKKVWLVLCLLFCLVSVGVFQGSAITLAADETSVSDADKQYLEEAAGQYIEQWNSFDFEGTLVAYADTIDEAAKAEYTKWIQLKAELGAYVETLDSTINKAGSAIIITTNIKYENANAISTLTVDEVSGMSTFAIDKADGSADANADNDTTEKMEKAGLNTVMGMGIVIVALFFISLIIGLFKFIPKIVDTLQKKSRESEKEALGLGLDNVLTNIIEQETEELVDDLELVAVVTAAIMASMGDEVPADGLVVRSIKRRNSNKWQKA